MDGARRQLLRSALGLGAGLVGSALELGLTPAPAAAAAPGGLESCRPAGDPLARLLAGNRRFARVWQGAARTADQEERRRLYAGLMLHDCFLDPRELTAAQRPWVALLTCADARIAPDLVFGVTPGEMFEVRSAGNTAFNAGIASLEYAVVELGVPLIVVMGHSGCGAVQAARAGAPLTPLLEELVQPIRAVLQPGDSLSQAIRANAAASAGLLSQRSAVLRQAQAAGELRIQPLVFDLASGLVRVL